MRTIFLFLFSFLVVSVSGQSLGKPEPIDPVALANAKLKVEASPDSVSYHDEFIKAAGWTRNLIWQSEKYPGRFDSVLTTLKDQYQKWQKQFPKCYAVPYAIGTAFYEAESPLATEFLLKAVKLNPKLAEGYMKLAIDAERWGKQEEAKEYMRKASVADPTNPSYEFYYVMYFDEVDMKIFKEKIYDLAKKFPTHERGAQGLYWLGSYTKDETEKTKIYEDLKSIYPPSKFSWSESGMYGLMICYLNSKQFDKAIALAESLQSKPAWKSQLRYAKGYTMVSALAAKGDYKTALDSITALSKIRMYGMGNKLQLLEAELNDKSGKTKQSYENLVKLQAKEPTEELAAALKTYASKIGKTEGDISKDVWAERDKNSKPAAPFELGLYTSDKKAKLTDYAGKVVLLTFWFPGCGPCRGEFPNFENVVRKFKGQDLAYLAINVAPIQDPYVIPFVKGTKYSFTPLRGDSDFAQKAYGVRGEPTNFLIDKKGNIVFANFRTDRDNERTLEMMISGLLERN